MRRIPASSFRTEGPTISLGAAVLSNSHILAISTVWVLDDLGLFSGCWTDGQLMIIACEIVKTIPVRSNCYSTYSVHSAKYHAAI